MKVKELREMSGDQRRTTLAETQKKLFDLRVQARMEKLDSPSEVVKARKMIARIKTIENENRQSAENDGLKQNLS